MEVTTCLPFDFCDTCPKFELNAKQETLYMDSLGCAAQKAIHSITITCEHRHLCENMKKQQEENRTSDMPMF